jgi:hypothetical protein
LLEKHENAFPLFDQNKCGQKLWVSGFRGNAASPSDFKKTLKDPSLKTIPAASFFPDCCQVQDVPGD